MRAGGDGSGGGGGSGGRGGGVRSIFSSAAPSATKIGSSTRSAITISAQMNSSTRAQSNALQLKHLSFFLRCLLSFFLRCLRTRLRLLSCSTSSLSSSSELSSSLPPSPPRRVGTVWKRFSPRILPMVDRARPAPSAEWYKLTAKTAREVLLLLVIPLVSLRCYHFL